MAGAAQHSGDTWTPTNQRRWLNDIQFIVLIFSLLLHRQLLQRCIDIQLIGLQLPQQRLPLKKGKQAGAEQDRSL